MAFRTPSEDDPLLPSDFDLSQIFIGREQQLDLFRIYLERWQRQDAFAPVQLKSAPSPNDKIQGLVVLMHGRGGFGKSTLLKYYYRIALNYEQELYVGKIIDWEFAAPGKRALFNLADGEKVDFSQYFTLLRNQLANVLNKRSGDFKEFQSAVKVVDDVKRLTSDVLDGLQRDNRYSWLRGFASEGVLVLLRLIPYSQALLSNEQIAKSIKDVVGESVQIGVEQVQQVWEQLHEKLGSKFIDYLEQSLCLGQAMGHDLAQFAKKRPVLIFFDTYEEIDEADELLRLVMGAAGARVGWVLAGRDNLWAGLSQRLRSQDTVYGYKDIVISNRGLAVDFSADGVGDFTLSDIVEYFAQLCRRVSRQPSLPTISEKDAAHILDVTKGVPLAVKIAANLYLEKPDLTFLTGGIDSKREIVDQMVRRYLLHTRTNPGDRARLYGLALLRRAEEPSAIAAALDFPVLNSYNVELSRLHRRYGFVFTKQEQPSLHQEVRHFLRLWLLEHHAEPEVAAINQRLKETHQAALQELETHRQYASVRARLEDEQWVECYLDLAEQYFWLDSAQGVAFLLPFMLAAAIYHRQANREVFKVGTFFEPIMSHPHRKHWEWAAQSLRYTISRNPLPDELTGLKDLVKLASQGGIAFMSPLPSAQGELEAALWCRLGEAYQGRQEDEALYWYKKAFSRLSQETGLNEEEAKALLDVDIDQQKQNEKVLVQDEVFRTSIEQDRLSHDRDITHVNTTIDHQAPMFQPQHQLTFLPLPVAGRSRAGWVVAGVMSMIVVIALVVAFLGPLLSHGNTPTPSPTPSSTPSSTPSPVATSTSDISAATFTISIFCSDINSGNTQGAYILTSQNYQNQNSAIGFNNQFSNPNLFKGGCLYNRATASNGNVVVPLTFSKTDMYGSPLSTTNYMVTLIQDPQSGTWVIDSIV